MADFSRDNGKEENGNLQKYADKILMELYLVPFNLRGPAVRIMALADLLKQELENSKAEEQEMITSISHQAKEILSYLEKLSEDVEMIKKEYRRK